MIHALWHTEKRMCLLARSFTLDQCHFHLYDVANPCYDVAVVMVSRSPMLQALWWASRNSVPR